MKMLLTAALGYLESFKDSYAIGDAQFTPYMVNGVLVFPHLPQVNYQPLKEFWRLPVNVLNEE